MWKWVWKGKIFTQFFLSFVLLVLRVLSSHLLEPSPLYDNHHYHEECLRCNSCAINLTGVNQKRARRFKNQILCDLHFAGNCRNEWFSKLKIKTFSFFADVALMECSDFMQQLRSFKPQSLGSIVARRKSSTTLIFPLPPQACSGKREWKLCRWICRKGKKSFRYFGSREVYWMLMNDRWTFVYLSGKFWMICMKNGVVHSWWLKFLASLWTFMWTNFRPFFSHLNNGFQNSTIILMQKR